MADINALDMYFVTVLIFFIPIIAVFLLFRVKTPLLHGCILYMICCAIELLAYFKQMQNLLWLLQLLIIIVVVVYVLSMTTNFPRLAAFVLVFIYGSLKGAWVMTGLKMSEGPFSLDKPQRITEYVDIILMGAIVGAGYLFIGWIVSLIVKAFKKPICE